MPKLPDNILNAMFHVRVRPSDEWMKANGGRESAAEEQIPDEQLSVELVGCIEWIQTSALRPAEEWTAQLIEIGVLKRLTLAELKRLAVNQLAAARGVKQDTPQ